MNFCTRKLPHAENLHLRVAVTEQGFRVNSRRCAVCDLFAELLQAEFIDADDLSEHKIDESNFLLDRHLIPSWFRTYRTLKKLDLVGHFLLGFRRHLSCSVLCRGRILESLSLKKYSHYDQITLTARMFISVAPSTPLQLPPWQLVLLSHVQPSLPR